MCGAAASPLPAPYLPTTHNTYTHTFSLSHTHHNTTGGARQGPKGGITGGDNCDGRRALPRARADPDGCVYLCALLYVCVVVCGGVSGCRGLVLGRAFLFPTVHIWRAYKTPYGHPQSNDKKNLITPHTQHRADAPDPCAPGASGLPRAGRRHVWGPGLHGQEPTLPPPGVRACVCVDAINCT